VAALTVWKIKLMSVVSLMLPVPKSHRENKSVVQGKKSYSIELEKPLPVKKLQCKRLHFVVEEIVAQHEGRFLLHYLMDNHRRLFGVIIGIATKPEHDICNHHCGKAPNHIQMGHIIQQATLSAHNKVNLGFQENPENAHHKTGRHIGYALWAELAICYHTKRQDFIMKLKEIWQIGLRRCSR